MKTYFELNEIVKKYPFLKEPIRSECSLFSLFNKEDFDDIDKFCEEYDKEEDLCGLLKWGWRYKVDDNTKIVYNLSKQGSFDDLDHAQIKFRICCNLLKRINFSTEEFNQEICDELKEKHNVCDGIISSIFNETSHYWSCIRMLTDPKQMIHYLSGPVLDYLEEINSYFYDKPKTVGNVENHYYLKTPHFIVRYILNNATESDAIELQEILRKHPVTAKCYAIDFVNNDVTDPTVKNIFSPHDSNEFYDNLKKSVTKTKLQNYTKTFVDYINTDVEVSLDGFIKFIDNCIIQNPKIKDDDFPTSKDCIIHEFLTRLIFNNKLDIIKLMRSASYDKFIKKFSKYIYDPYFLTSIVLVPKYYTTDVSKFVSGLFTKDFIILYNIFVENYFDEIDKPVARRKSTVGGCKKEFISYGVLYNILTSTKMSFYSLDIIGSNKPNIKIFSTLLTQTFPPVTKSFDISHDSAITLANERVSFYNDCKISSYSVLKEKIINFSVYSNVSKLFEFIESEHLSEKFYEDFQGYYAYRDMLPEQVELGYQYVRLAVFEKALNSNINDEDFENLKNYVFRHRTNICIMGSGKMPAHNDHRVNLSKFWLYLVLYRINNKRNLPLTFSANTDDFISGYNQTQTRTNTEYRPNILLTLSTDEMKLFKPILIDGLFDEIKFGNILDFCVTEDDRYNMPIYTTPAYDDLILNYKINSLISDEDYVLAKNNLEELRISYKCKHILE